MDFSHLSSVNCLSVGFLSSQKSQMAFATRFLVAADSRPIARAMLLSLKRSLDGWREYQHCPAIFQLYLWGTRTADEKMYSTVCSLQPSGDLAVADVLAGLRPSHRFYHCNGSLRDGKEFRSIGCLLVS
jgi:hypothetical protein